MTVIDLIKSNDFEGFKKALNESPAQSKEADNEGMTPLHWAARSKNVEFSKHLVDSCKVGIYNNFKNNGYYRKRN